MQRLFVLINQKNNGEEGVLDFKYGTLVDDCCKETRKPDQLLEKTYIDALDFSRLCMAAFNDGDLSEISTLSNNVIDTVVANHDLISSFKKLLTRETRKEGKLEFVKVRWIV